MAVETFFRDITNYIQIFIRDITNYIQFCMLLHSPNFVSLTCFLLSGSQTYFPDDPLTIAN